MAKTGVISSNKRDYPQKVMVRLYGPDLSKILKWLHNQGHVLRETMMFGSSKPLGSEMIDLEVLFKERDAAMHFKLVWS